MSIVGDQLPAEASDVLEYALAAGMSAVLPIPYEEILDPYTCPERFLPVLAAHYSVDLWFDDWTIERKREAIAQSAGRSTLFPGQELAALKGTRLGAARYLALVDAEIVDTVAYPAPAFVNDAFCGSAILQHPPFLATHLVSVETAEPDAAFAGSAFAGEDFAGRTITKPYDRCLAALRVAKSAHMELRVDFQNFRIITAGDGLTAGSGYAAGQTLARTKL